MPSWEVSEEVGFISMNIQWKQFAAVPSGFYLEANSRCSAVDWYWCNESEMAKASFLLQWSFYQVFIQWDKTLNKFYYDNQHFKWHTSFLTDVYCSLLYYECSWNLFFFFVGHQ